MPVPASTRAVVGPVCPPTKMTGGSPSRRGGVLGLDDKPADAVAGVVVAVVVAVVAAVVVAAATGIRIEAGTGAVAGADVGTGIGAGVALVPCEVALRGLELASGPAPSRLSNECRRASSCCTRSSKVGWGRAGDARGEADTEGTAHGPAPSLLLSAWPCAAAPTGAALLLTLPPLVPVFALVMAGCS